MITTVFVTVFSGVLIFVGSEFVLKFILEPGQEMKRTIGQISFTLIERANLICDPGHLDEGRMDTTSRELRGLGSKLLAHLCLIPAYSFSSRLFFLPSRKKVSRAADCLIGLSNMLSEERYLDENRQSLKTIRDCLGIHVDVG